MAQGESPAKVADPLVLRQGTAVRFETDLELPVKSIMTPRERLIYVKEGASPEEAKALPMLAEHFDKVDTNHDGKVTREELKAMRQQRR